MVRNGKRGGQPGGFDAVQVHQPVDAVIERALDQKIPGVLARRLELGANPRVIGLNSAVGKGREITPNRIVKHVRPPWINVVIERFDPFHVGSEPHPAGHIDGRVDPETSLFRYRIHRTVEWYPALCRQYRGRRSERTNRPN